MLMSGVMPPAWVCATLYGVSRGSVRSRGIAERELRGPREEVGEGGNQRRPKESG